MGCMVLFHNEDCSTSVWDVTKGKEHGKQNFQCTKLATQLNFIFMVMFMFNNHSRKEKKLQKMAESEDYKKKRYVKKIIANVKNEESKN